MTEAPKPVAGSPSSAQPMQHLSARTRQGDAGARFRHQAPHYDEGENLTALGGFDESPGVYFAQPLAGL